MIIACDVDVALFSALNGNGGSAADFFMYWVSVRATWIPLYLLVMWLIWRRYGVMGMVVFFVVGALMITCVDQTATLFKVWVPKFRPTHDSSLIIDVHTVYGYRGGLYGTLSSHAGNAMALMILMGMALDRRWVWVMMGVWVVLMSYSRIYLGVHYPVDIAWGLLDGVFWGVLWWLVLRKLLSLRFIGGERQIL